MDQMGTSHSADFPAVARSKPVGQQMEGEMSLVLHIESPTLNKSTSKPKNKELRVEFGSEEGTFRFRMWRAQMFWLWLTLCDRLHHF